MKRRIPLIDYIRPFTVGLIILLVAGGLLAFKLGSLLPSMSPAEHSTYQNALPGVITPRVILENSLFFAYKVGLYGLQAMGILSFTTIRALSALCGLVGAISFYLILRKWHTRRVALMGGFIFVTSSWFLQASRAGRPEAMYLLLPLLLYLGIKLEEGTQRLSVAVASAILVTQLLYLPGMVWLLVAGLIWQHQRITDRIREIHTAALLAMGIMSVVLLVPLGISMVSNHDFLLQWLAYPFHDQSIKEFLHNVLAVPYHLFIKHALMPEFHVGRLAVLDVATSGLVLLGLYKYFLRRKLDRSKLIVAGLVFGTLLTAALGLTAQVIIMPFIYLLATGGITLMLQRWFTVFPRNPLARGVGLGTIIVIVGLIGLYQTQRYFVAWAGSPDTRSVYSLQSATIEQ